MHWYLVKKSVLITGSTGFLGRHFAENFSKSDLSIISKSRVDGDVCDEQTWLKYEPVDNLLHLAGPTFVPDSWASPSNFIENSSLGTLNALEYCRRTKARFVFLSTYMYSQTRGVAATESGAIVPKNPYALSKFLGETLCNFYSEHFGVATVIIRPFNIYGVNQNPKFLVPTILEQALVGDEIHVQDVRPSRDYVYITDFIDAIKKVIESEVKYDVFNIGSGISYSVEELIETLGKVVGRKLKIVSAMTKRPEEIDFTQADNSHAKAVLGWQPSCSLFDGLSDIWKTLRSV